MVSGNNLKQGIKLLNLSDIVLVVIILVAICFSLFLQLSGTTTGTLQVTIDDYLLGKYQLNEDRQIELNQGTILEIKDGKYRLVSSICKGQICVKQGWSSSQPIICVPQRLIISVVHESDKRELPLTY
jgi:hypothetical protein